jgi:transposase-like protein
MTHTNPSEGPNQSPEKKRRYLTAEKKFQIYLEAQDGTKPVGELLRREGLYSTDLARIRQQVREGALQRLGAKPGRQQDPVNPDAYQAIKHELQEKERTLADLSVELAILRKKTNGGSWDR